MGNAPGVMGQDENVPGSALPHPQGAARGVLLARLILGVAQGLALAILAQLVDAPEAPHPWVAANPKAFGLLVLLSTFLPLPVLLGLGHLRGRVLAAWTLAAAVLILLLGGHDLRQHGGTTMTPGSILLLFSLGAILLVGGALVAAADAGRRWWPRYPDCFEAAWRTALQLAIAGCFVLGFWMVYWIGTGLFRGIGIDVLDRLGGRAAFTLPVTAVLGAAAVHLADARWRLTLGLRNLLLTLKGWLTPPLAGLTAAFLLALPFAGPEMLWHRDEAPTFLFTTAAGLVVLVSAVHGDGRERPPAILRFSARLASFLLPLVTALAAWGLARVIAAGGLTEEGVIGLAVLTVLAVHAVFYPVAALRPDMRLLGPTNIGAAMLALLVLASLNSPLADPARLEARSQTDRLLRRAVAPDVVNFGNLAQLGRHGRRAVERLARHPDPEIARRAALALLPPDRAAGDAAANPVLAPRLRALPDGTLLPPGLAEAMREALPECLVEECLARAFPGAGESAWLVGPVQGGLWAMRPEGEAADPGPVPTWRRVATYEPSLACWDRVPGAFLNGSGRAVPPPLPNLDFDGVTLRPVLQREGCE